KSGPRSGHGGANGRGSGPVRTTPIAILQRKNAPAWNALVEELQTGLGEERGLSPAAQEVLDHLSRHGAAFFDEMVQDTRLLRTQVEAALGELVAGGLVTADSFTGLRALLVPSG